jgi:hypothetical protein
MAIESSKSNFEGHSVALIENQHKKTTINHIMATTAIKTVCKSSAFKTNEMIPPYILVMD